MKSNAVIESINLFASKDVTELSDYSTLTYIEKKYLPILFDEIKDAIERYRYEISVFNPDDPSE